MGTIYIHIGLPRTATTSIQKHLLPKSKNKLIFQKDAYSSSVKITDSSRSTGSASVSSLLNRLKAIETPINATQRSTYLKEILLFLSSQPHDWNETEERTKNLEIARELAISLLTETSKTCLKEVLISTERLADTSSSFICNSKLVKEKEFPVISLSRTIKKYTDNAPCVITCLRDPISYLRSKYCRTRIQRKLTNERSLTTYEYIQKQATLESNNPNTSVLAQAMHSEFIKQLQKHSFVKAFGFQELLASDDVFSLMGLQGENKYAFRDFPRENKLPFTKEQELAIEVEITQALKQYGFYDRIMRAQMFE